MDTADGVLERILDAATEEFGKKGYLGAKVDGIARRAGVNKAGLYYHVGNKDKLYEAVLLRLFEQVAGTLEGAVADDADPVQGFAGLTKALAELFSRLPMLPRIMAMEMGSGGGTMPDVAMAEFQRIFGVTRKLLARGQESGTLRPAEPVFVHMTLVGTLVVYALSEPLRRRFAAAARGMGLRLDLPLVDAAAFLADIVGRGLARDAGAQEEAHDDA